MHFPMTLHLWYSVQRCMSLEHLSRSITEHYTSLTRWRSWALITSTQMWKTWHLLWHLHFRFSLVFLNCSGSRWVFENFPVRWDRETNSTQIHLWTIYLRTAMTCSFSLQQIKMHTYGLLINKSIIPTSTCCNISGIFSSKYGSVTEKMTGTGTRLQTLYLTINIGRICLFWII